MNDMRKAWFVLLVLVGLTALAQTQPAGTALKARAPMFIDFGVLSQPSPATNAPSTTAVIAQRPDILAGTNVPAASPVSLSGYVPDDKYKLRVGDRVSLQILEDRDAPRSLVVADSGELDVPYVGRVQAADKTSKQLADELKTQLEKEYYHRATVVIALDLANKLLGRVYVWGQVRNQGLIDIALNENLTAGKAILRVGGFADFANKKRVKVVRGAGADSAGKRTFELNMVDILEKGKAENDVVLQPDDFIIVPSRLISF
jgi:protein involved in polysaccharide export with SLBB domain